MLPENSMILAIDTIVACYTFIRNATTYVTL